MRAPPKQFTAWSFSRYKDHRECPRRAKLKHLDKLPEGPRGPALVRGEAIHKEAEDYVKGTRRRLPASLKLFSREFALLRKVSATAEGKWAMTVKWEPVDFFDWDHAWCRVVLDAHYAVKKRDTISAKAIDYKTGKIYPDHEEQLELYALGCFSRYPEAQVVEVENWYIDIGPQYTGAATYERGALPLLQKKWRQKVIPLLTDKKFPPTPGQHCGRCPYSQRRGGPCEF